MFGTEPVHRCNVTKWGTALVVSAADLAWLRASAQASRIGHSPLFGLEMFCDKVTRQICDNVRVVQDLTKTENSFSVFAKTAHMYKELRICILFAVKSVECSTSILLYDIGAKEADEGFSDRKLGSRIAIIECT